MQSAVRSPQSAVRSPQSAVRSPLTLKAFTLVEILSTVAIMAVLATLAMFFTANYVTWAKNTADKQTLSVLNDALNRYKCQGGDVNSLTLGAPISNILTRLKAPVTWGGTGGLSHQFLQSAFTYPARSLDAIGERAQYHFFTAGSYASETVDSNTSTARNYYPYGFGVGYFNGTGNGSGNYRVFFGGNSWFAAKHANGTITYIPGNWQDIPADGPITFWACAGNGNSTPSGNISSITFLHGGSEPYTGFFTEVDVNGLTSLTSLRIDNNTSLTHLGIANSASLQFLEAMSVKIPTGTAFPASINNIYIIYAGYSTAELNALYAAIPDRTGKSAGVLDIAEIGQAIPNSNTSVAHAKNWTSPYGYW